jgi:hypothetical protein
MNIDVRNMNIGAEIWNIKSRNKNWNNNWNEYPCPPPPQF